MPETNCPQLRALADRGIASLCLSCRNRAGCADAVALELAERFTPPEAWRVYIVAECGGYEEVPGMKDAPTRGNIGPQLFQAGVTDRCSGCLSSTKASCLTRDALDRVSRASIVRGGWVRPQVVCCDMSQALHQISDPAAGK